MFFTRSRNGLLFLLIIQSVSPSNSGAWKELLQNGLLLDFFGPVDDNIIDCHRFLLKTDNNRCYRKIANFPAIDYRFYRLITPGNTHDATFYLKGLFASASCLQNSDDLTDVVLISVSKRFFHSLILSKYLFDKDSATLLQRYIILQQR